MKITPTFFSLIAAAAIVGCGSEKKKDDMTSPPAAAPELSEKTTPAAKAEAVFEGPGERLSKKVGEWAIKGAPRYFGPDNLYDLINGGSEVYTEYGLKKMVTADYVSEKQQALTITAEIYEMTAPLGAFGRFSRFLESKADPSKAGDGLPEAIAPNGIFGGANATFWKGPYLVNLTLMDESPDATMESMKAAGAKSLPELADAIANNISEPATLPEALQLFPDALLVSQSQVYVAKSLAGIDALGAGFTARYKKESEEWTLLMTETFADETAIEKALKTITDDPAQKDKVVLNKAGNRIVGIVGVPTKLAKRHLDLLVSTLTQ